MEKSITKKKRGRMRRKADMREGDEVTVVEVSAEVLHNLVVEVEVEGIFGGRFTEGMEIAV